MENIKDRYFVAVKVFLENEEGNFLIARDRFSDWDIPGGRLRPEDFDVPFDRVVERKMREELGDAVQYDLGDPVVFMRHERNEVLPSGERELRRIFAVGYRARYMSGTIVLGKNHTEFRWVSITTVDPALYFTGGWLRGVEEYLRKMRA